MHKHVFRIVVTAAIAAPLYAQSFPRSATMRGGGNGREGKCTIEVNVDSVAEVEIRGSNAVLRNISGQPAEWRRFECDSVMPPNPANFRFQGIDGRGRQTLIRDPRNGGAAVVRIEDPQSGREGYTFDIMWSADNYSQNGRGAYPPPAAPYPPPGGPDYRTDRGPGQAPPPNRDYDRFHDERRNYGRDDWRQRIFQRVREDVDHVQSETFPRGGDSFRLGQVQRELDEMQGKLSAGRYDQRELDDVIATLNNVVRDNRMSARDRDILSDDLNHLRDFRERHNDYGAR